MLVQKAIWRLLLHCPMVPVANCEDPELSVIAEMHWLRRWSSHVYCFRW